MSLADYPPAEPSGSADARRQSDQARIRVPKTAEVVADQIRRRIIRGELREGDFLPLEGQVMVSLGISRPTLREAFRILEAENLISVMRGSRSGARVHQPQVESASRYAGFVLQAQSTTIADIYEARLAIEPFVARRLAETRPAGAVERLLKEVDRLHVMVEEHRHREFMIEVVDFHRLLVEVSGMRTLLFLTQLLQEVVARYQVQYLERAKIPNDALRQTSRVGINSFRKLIRLVDTGDANGAEVHWRLHLSNANAAWVPPGQQPMVVDVFG